ncbi:MAG TPA: hypothetical protein VKQ28_00795 [Candidatus Acidoferrum sp.]|nr:hypothetical protein [Candidatus Acidoferrum sp.]
MPRPQIQFDTREIAVICNISEQTMGPVMRDYGAFIVQGCKEGLRLVRHVNGEIEEIECEKGQEYALTEITGRDTRVDVGEKNSRLEYVYATQIAEDLVRVMNANVPVGAITDDGEAVASFSGVFLCKGNTPTKTELAEAHAKLKLFYQGSVSMADALWEQHHNPIFIDAVMRRAARSLGLIDKPWLFDTKTAEKCPACAEQVKAGAVVCRHCGFVLDQAKAKKLGIGEKSAA